MATYVLIFNQCTLEYLLFPESAVMCFSLLCMVLASIETIENSKYKYLKIFLLLLLSTLSYQGLIMAFPIMTLFLQLINLKNIQKDGKSKVWKDLIKCAIITIIVLVVETLVIIVTNSLLGGEFIRNRFFYDFELFIINIKYSQKISFLMLMNSMNLLPKMFLPIVLFISLTITIINKNLRGYFIQIIVLIYMVLIENMVYMLIFDMGQTGRANWITLLLWGIALIYLLVNLNKDSRIGKVIIMFVIISFTFNSFMLLQNSAWHTAANIVDKNDGYIIKSKIEKYERETGKKITKFAYMCDDNVACYAPGIKHLGSLSERALSCPWCIKEALNYYTDRKLEEVGFQRDLSFQIMNKDYEGFSEEQLYLIEDTIYIVIY